MNAVERVQHYATATPQEAPYRLDSDPVVTTLQPRPDDSDADADAFAAPASDTKSAPILASAAGKGEAGRGAAARRWPSRGQLAEAEASRCDRNAVKRRERGRFGPCPGVARFGPCLRCFGLCKAGSGSRHRQGTAVGRGTVKRCVALNRLCGALAGR